MMKAFGWSLLAWGLVLAPWSFAETRRVPEEHASIQAAIDASTAGDTILVSEGTYQERIVLKEGIILRSEGGDDRGERGLLRAERTVIDGGGEKGTTPGVTLAEGATLDGFTVTQVGRFDEALWQKHWKEKGEHQSHERIGTFAVPAIAVEGVSCRVANNVVHHNGDTGIAIRGKEGARCHPWVSDNVCYRNMGGGIGVMAGALGQIEGNRCFENFYAGIGHRGASPVVTNNVCHGNVRAGIGISEGASPVVRGNRCYANRRAGIGIRTGEGTRPLIEDNDCYENAMAGIGVDEAAAPVVRGNRAYGNELAGIGCRAGARAVLQDNHCYENQAAGIGVSSASPLIEGNRLEKNATAGIGIRGGSSVRVINNTCLENRLVAIGIPDGARAVLQGNTLKRTGGMPPMVAIFGESEVTMVENEIHGGGVAGILLEGKLIAVANVLQGANGGAGIAAKEGSELTESGNRIEGYRKRIAQP